MSVKVAVRTAPGHVVFLDAAEIYYVEAAGGDTRLRTRHKRTYSSPRRLAEWEQALGAAGFERIHKSYLVNLARIRELRLREQDTNDWELKLDPPVNAVLPVSRSGLGRLRKRYGF